MAFAAITAIFVTFMAASSAPSPLYVVYQQQWGFSAITLTVVFAVYVFGLIGSLLVLGALSDYIGRRPVLAAAIALELVALVLFITAGDVTVLLIARLLQGIATGAAMTTLGAALVDLEPPACAGQGRRGQRCRTAGRARGRRSRLRRSCAVRPRANASRVHPAARRDGRRRRSSSP